MINQRKDNGFSYTLISKEQSEIRRIREKYVKDEKPEDKMERLRRLDESSTRKGTALSLVLGVIGTLLLGTGMSLIMTPFGDALGIWKVILGVIVGTVGLGTAALAYPFYSVITKKERARLAPEIIRLSDELLK